MNTKNNRITALRAAFPNTIPVMAGYLFLGMAYGIFMRASGFPFYFPILTCVLVFAGSAEFLTVSMLLGPFAPLKSFLMILMVNARHLFYGISMLSKYRDMGRKKPYLIFALTDETFSVNCSADVPPHVDRGRFYFFVTLLDHCYWITGVTLGSLFGSFLHFNTEGLDFAMTALFVVIFLEQWLKEEKHICSLLGLALPIICLLIFGAEDFIIPAMLAILGVLTLLRGILEKGGDPA